MIDATIHFYSRTAACRSLIGEDAEASTFTADIGLEDDMVTSNVTTLDGSDES